MSVRQGRQGGQGRQALALIALGALGLLGALGEASAHGASAPLDEQLVEGGERLMVGEFDAPQAGALVVVPYVEGPLGCGESASAAYRVPISPESGVAFVANATTLQAVFDAPGHGLTAFAVDTETASRALILMAEHAIALHGMVAIVQPEGTNATLTQVRTGALGLPYAAGPATHDLGGPPTEDEGVLMDPDGSFPNASACVIEAGHFAISFPFSSLPGSLRTGGLVHVVAVRDPEIDGFLHRAERSTIVFPANLYLAEPNEDPARVRDALSPEPKLIDALPLVGVAVALALVTRRQ